MATTFSFTKQSAAQYAMAGVGPGQSGKIMACRYAWAANLVINDIIQSPLIQAGSTIVDVMLCTDSMGAAAVTLDVGYGVDPDYFIAASTIGVAGGVARASAITAKPLVLTENDTIDVLIKAAPTTPVAAGVLSLVIFYLPVYN